ncbi:putative von Willebrand factor type A [Magnetofaba australis IT-1]|uniref:Putative von Willebrand factor type A n=1 Tax=Magnetofaba australis IT-1 TaxID=1434232 RepID=A0A1Y2K8P0_9PROT|nr:putative von Willebrand factor type A [Magnetofaba australis IT-1]
MSPMPQQRMMAAGAPPALAQALPPPSRMRQEERENYKEVEDNPIKQVSAEPVSTFSIDVDTASYANMRRLLKQGGRLPADAIRIEELINYFSYDYPKPDSAAKPLAVSAKSYPSPWNPKTRLLHIGVQGYAIDAAQRPAANLVFLLDVSGSMGDVDKLDLAKKSFEFLVKALRAEDRVAIIAYSDETTTILEPTPGDQGQKILNALAPLRAEGSTNGSAGLQMAYALARQNFDPAKVNRVLIATDGDFNFGVTRGKTLEEQVADERKSGVYLSVLGFGGGNYNDELMQRLAQKGNGVALYVDSLIEAHKIYGADLFANLFPIANDVKIQVEFNPAQVAEYRLIGFETRQLRREDFQNDQVDAGEVGSGHRVTALYEYVPVTSDFRYMQPLRYAPKAKAAASSDVSREIAHVRLRYKLPGQPSSQLLTRPVGPADALEKFEQAPADMRFAAAVAGFGQLLRRSPHLHGFDFAAVRAIASAAKGDDPFGYRAEFINLIPLAERLR